MECLFYEAQTGGRLFVYENDQSKSDTVRKFSGTSSGKIESEELCLHIG